MIKLLYWISVRVISIYLKQIKFLFLLYFTCIVRSYLIFFFFVLTTQGCEWIISNAY